MQPLKLVIEGEFWDSQIYSGRLYLFKSDGSIKTVDWDMLINKWKLKKSLHLPMTCAYSNSQYLYSSKFKKFFGDREVKTLIQDKFKRLSQENLFIPTKKLDSYLCGQQDNLFPFPHSDCTIYNRIIYVGAKDGIFSASCGKNTKKPVSTRLTKENDIPALSLSPNYGNLAVAAGDEGLCQIPVNNSFYENNAVRKLSKKNCVGCSWNYESIYGSSHIDEGVLADFSYNRDEERRRFNKLYFQSQIFKKKQLGYSWGAQDKICLASKNKISVVRYSSYSEDEKLQFLGEFTMDAWKGKIVSAGVALFGNVVECDNAMVVFPSEGHAINIPGEPVNWRIFPRARNYENHLHIVYEDRLEIYSFNHDYFVDQDQKISGFRAPKSYFRKKYR